MTTSKHYVAPCDLCHDESTLWAPRPRKQPLSKVGDTALHRRRRRPDFWEFTEESTVARRRDLPAALVRTGGRREKWRVRIPLSAPPQQPRPPHPFAVTAGITPSGSPPSRSS